MENNKKLLISLMYFRSTGTGTYELGADMFRFASILEPQTQIRRQPASRLLPLLYRTSNQDISGQNLSKMEALLCAYVIAIMYTSPHIFLQVSH